MIELRKRFHEGLEGQDLLDAIDASFKDIEEYLNLSINQKHAPILIPRVTIDAAHAQKNIAAASAAAIWTAFSWQNSTTSTSGSYATAVDYVGRGVLTKFAISETTSGANNNRTFGAKITVDGNILFQDDTAALTRESALRVLVGNLFDVSGTNLGITDAHPGIPFNSECKLEILSDGTRTLNAGWKISKKL